MTVKLVVKPPSSATFFSKVMSLKFHIIHYIVKDIEKQLEKDKQKVDSIKRARADLPVQDPPAKTPFLDRWIKWQLVGREEDGYPVYQENFLRQVPLHLPCPYTCPTRKIVPVLAPFLPGTFFCPAPAHVSRPGPAPASGLSLLLPCSCICPCLAPALSPAPAPT